MEKFINACMTIVLVVLVLFLLSLVLGIPVTELFGER